MENIIIESRECENTDSVFEYSKLENTDYEEILSNLSDEFIPEKKLLNENNNWYCLPFILSNKILHNQKNIEDVSSLKIGDEINIIVKYKPYFVHNNSEEFNKESCEHYINQDAYDTVSYVVSEKNKYICDMIINHGINVLDTDLIRDFILT